MHAGDAEPAVAIAPGPIVVAVDGVDEPGGVVDNGRAFGRRRHRSRKIGRSHHNRRPEGNLGETLKLAIGIAMPEPFVTRLN